MHLDPGCRPRTPFYRFPDSFYRILQSSSLIPTTPESASESAGAAAVTLAEPRKDPAVGPGRQVRHAPWFPAVKFATRRILSIPLSKPKPNGPQIYQTLPSFTKFYQVLPSFTKFYQVLPNWRPSPAQESAAAGKRKPNGNRDLEIGGGRKTETEREPRLGNRRRPGNGNRTGTPTWKSAAAGKGKPNGNRDLGNGRGGAKRRPGEKLDLRGGWGNAPRSGVPAANALLSVSGFLLQNPPEFLSDSNDAGIGI